MQVSLTVKGKLYANAGSYILAIDNQVLKIARGVYFLRYEDIQNKTELKFIVQ